MKVIHEEDSAAHREETAALLENMAARYRRGEKFGAILIAAMLPEGHVAVSGVAPAVNEGELLVFVGIVGAAIGGIVDASKGLEDKTGDAMKLLRTVQGGTA
ncbi:MAG TPA: hypothetical protein VIY27_13805 [Myxococcota bacterium]